MHSFRLHARLGNRWRFPSSTVTLQLDGLNPVILSHGANNFELDDDNLWQRDDIDAVRVFFTSHGYTTLQDAQFAATKLRHMLALFGAKQSAAIDPGLVDMLSDLRRDNPEFRGIQFSEIAGFPDSIHYSGGGHKTLTRIDENFESRLNALATKCPLPAEQVRALAVLINNQFPGGIKGFLDDGLGTLVARVSAIEAMATCPKRSKQVQDCIDKMRDIVDADENLTGEERDKLRNGLGNMRNESISQSCRDLIDAKIDPQDFPPPADEIDHLVTGPTQQFTRAYGMRSTFLHSGSMPEENVNTLANFDLLRQVGFDLEEIVRRIVLETDNGV